MKNSCQWSVVSVQGPENREQAWVARVSMLRPGKGIRQTSHILASALIFALVLLSGCRADMQNQPKMYPQRGSELFADHRSARPQPANTVARGQMLSDSFFLTGTVPGADGYRQEPNAMPFAVTMEVLRRGQEQFNLYCAPCHSRVGNGLGEIVQRGFKPAANLQDQVRLAQPVSRYFYVMTYGYNAMPEYATQIAPEDRWAVAAYIRALQLSQAAKLSDVPPGVTVRDLKDFARDEGLPASDAEPWTAPANAVNSYQPAEGAQR